MNRIATLALVSLCAAASLVAAPVTVKSPNGKITASFEVKDGTLLYSVAQGDRQTVAPSKIEIIAGAKMDLLEHSEKSNDTSWKPTWGQFSTIRDHHNELSLSLKAGDIPVTLLCRVFDAGLGFRFVLSDESKGQKLTFYNGYKLAEEDGYYYPQGESGVPGPLRRDKLKGVHVPAVQVREDNSALALLESDIYSAVPFGAMKMHYHAEQQSIISSSTVTSIGAGQVTPWRVILLVDKVGDLTVSTVALNLAAPCQLEDTSWIKAGKGLWDWRVHGYNNGEFVYGIDTRSYLRFIDFCSEQGIEYFTIDDHWFKKAGNGKMDIALEIDIEKVMAYAKEKGVKIKLYYDRKKGNFGDETLFSYYAGLGGSAIKYGFMGNKADFTRDAMEAAAENKMVINFHDGPVPMTGVERTLPNLVTRELCHAQQDSRRAFTPETFLKMVMVNALTGPLDMANGNFGLNSINAGERQKGPRKQNSYISTVVSEVARTLVVYSGIITLPDAPEEYLKKADLFEFLKQMPATWDDTKVLHAEVGKYISLARRTGDQWFVGSVNDQSERTLEITLDFLASGKTYQATLFQDAPDSHGVKNPEAYQITTQEVKQGDVIQAKMAFGGGHAIILNPVK
jgi:hypothetical protein